MKNEQVSYLLTNPDSIMRTSLLIVLLAVVRSSFCPAQKPIEPRTLQAIDRYIDTLQQTWNIPGLALAIVYKDQLVYAKGYGYRNIEQQLPVTPTTLFPIASNTKLFTATAACLLAEEGKLDVHQPASTYLPSLKFYTDELTAKVTLTDMLSHRTGLPRYDGIWAGATFTRPEMIRKIAYMKPALGFREGYLYNNMMYVAAGAVLEAVTGQTWEQVIQEKILNPLGMTSSCFTDEQMEKTGNYATSYYEPDTTNRLAPVSVKWQCEALGPAGTLRSNLEEMSHWMIAQLNTGKYREKAVFPEKVIRQTLIPNNISDREGRYEELSHALYGLGRTMQTYKGIKIATHTGSIDGFYSNLTLVPQHGLAVFMVHNSSPAGSLRSVMTLPVIDLLLKQSYTPWSQRYRKNYLADKRTEQQQRDSLLNTKVSGTQPSHSLADYAGTYFSPVYGEIRIAYAGDQLTLHFRNFHVPLAHFHYDQFYNPDPRKEWSELKVRFSTSDLGRVDKLSVSIFGDPVTEFSKQ